MACAIPPPRTSKNDKRAHLPRSISTTPDVTTQCEPTYYTGGYKLRQGGGQAGWVWEQRSPNGQTASSVKPFLLLQAFQKTTDASRTCGITLKGKANGTCENWIWLHLFKGKVGGFSCLGNRLWICASWNSLCFSPKRVPTVPDKGFLLFGICTQPTFGKALFSALC